MLELLIRQHPRDPLSHDERLKDMFRAVKWAAELWTTPHKRPSLPDWCQYTGDTASVAERIAIDVDCVRYCSISRRDMYTFTPYSFKFQGTWGALLDGCPLCKVSFVGPPAPLRSDGLRHREDDPPVTPENAIRADIFIYAPITSYNTLVYYGEFYYLELFYECVNGYSIAD